MIFFLYEFKNLFLNKKKTKLFYIHQLRFKKRICLHITLNLLATKKKDLLQLQIKNMKFFLIIFKTTNKKNKMMQEKGKDE